MISTIMAYCTQVLYLDAIKLVPDSAEQVSEFMEEKELRQRAPLEEVKLLLAEATEHMQS